MTNQFCSPGEGRDPEVTQDQPGDATTSTPTTAVLLILRAGQEILCVPSVQRLRYGFTIGRGPAAISDERWQIDDAMVSRQQARLALLAEGWTLTDLGSRNGTVVGSELVRSRAVPLANGSVIAVAGQVAVFRLLTEEQLALLEAERRAPLGPVVSSAPALLALARRVRVLARTDRPLLLSGETGTGKEVYARLIHELSGRRGALVPVNCASLSRELFESELFGYRRGSHSQAHDDHPGLVASAQGGTLFLDEIGEMPAVLQAKLLRFLQDKTAHGLGATRARKLDVRIIAATQDPHETLRADILGRLGAEPLALPGLRDRREDIGPLCRHFVEAAGLGSALTIEGNAFTALCLHPWPRNVRELEAAVSEAALLAADRGAGAIELADLPTDVRATLAAVRGQASGASAPTLPADPRSEPVRPGRRPRPSRDELVRLLEEHLGDVPAVARQLDRQRELVWRWCKLLGIEPDAFKPGPVSGSSRPPAS